MLLKNNPTVSVLMTTYNQEKYIRDAIKGVLIQKTKFAIELIIGEDHSTDSTRDICNEYKHTNPEIIRILPSETNLGPLPNFNKCLEECNGKYIAICEGDDYWTDPLKLQKQVDFLNDNPDYAIVHTNKKVLLDDKIYDDKQIIINSGEVFEDLLCSNTICTLTVMVRSGIFKEAVKRVTSHPEISKLVAHDYAFWLEIALEYKIGFLNDVTGVYRFLPESLSHSLNPVKALSFDKYVIEIKEFYFKEYLKKNHNVNRGFRLRFGENVFHLKKRLLLDYGLLAKSEIFSLLKTDPIIYFYIIYKKLKKIFH